MKITNISYTQKNNTCVLSADIVLKRGKKHVIYFEVEKKYKDFIAKDTSPFLSTALPIAMKKRENLAIDGSVSKQVLDNTPEIMRILKGWNVGFHPVSIKPNKVTLDVEKSKNSACFFSGGVDSFYTYRKNKTNIQYLIFVHGFDINANNYSLYKKIEKNIKNIAKKDTIELVKVRTNIRDIFEQYFDWNMAHIFALASVSLFLRNGFKEIYMSCGQSDINEEHHFMSPELDILWSTENMTIRHYGCDADKIIKLKYLSGEPLAMENLRVCWLNKGKEYNCSECEKCFRNMLALYVSDSLYRCKTFKHQFNTGILKNIVADEHVLQYFIAAQHVLESKNDNSPVRLALEECIKRNKFPTLAQKVYRNTRSTFRYFDQKYNRNRLYWFLAQRGFIA